VGGILRILQSDWFQQQAVFSYLLTTVMVTKYAKCRVNFRIERAKSQNMTKTKRKQKQNKKHWQKQMTKTWLFQFFLIVSPTSPAALGRTRDLWHSFSQCGPTKADEHTISIHHYFGGYCKNINSKKKKKKRKQSAQSCKCLQVKWLLFSFSDWKCTIKRTLLAITKSCHLSFQEFQKKHERKVWIKLICKLFSS